MTESLLESQSKRTENPSAVFHASVVGSGPAGAVTALLLARQGRRVLLADAGGPGFDKVCGGYLGPEWSGFLESIGLGDAFRTLPKCPIRAIELSAPGAGRLRVELDGAGGWGVDRPTLDGWLVSRAVEAGVTLAPFCRFQMSERRGRMVWTRFDRGGRDWEVFSRVMIRATGRRVVRTGRTGRFFGCKTVYRDLPGQNGLVALHGIPNGHVGLDSLGGGRAILCLYAHADYLRSAAGNLDRMIDKMKEQNPALALALDGGSRDSGWISCVAEPDKRFDFGEGLSYPVGDAVTAFHPILGAGMSAAVQSGSILAEILVRNWERLSDSPNELRAQYGRRWHASLGASYQASHALGALEQHRSVTRACFGVFRRFPRLLARLIQTSRPFLRRTQNYC